MIPGAGRWVVCPLANPAAELRLFCFHHAGGNGQYFYRWANHLPAGVELAVIQLPGRGPRRREPHAQQVVPLCETIADAVSGFADLPFVFFGHSLGALLCFETARSLRRKGARGPARLIVSATEAPHRRTAPDALTEMSNDRLVEKLREFDGAPEEALQNQELLDLILPTVRADFALYESYRYRPEAPLACAISAYGGRDDAGVEDERLAAWCDLTTGSCRVRQFDGRHFYIEKSRSSFFSALGSELEDELRALRRRAHRGHIGPDRSVGMI
jgi:medium-chain acyl-[acyl-carrier-protein] hydrolase